ncbi:MAG TPA: class I SAM-dependent methyltransferase [Candidatus Saccharimonadales bacterium]|nr:class I SAM-dependent methyltransferase [Candidatus Saccharimonadales bacterium]
MTYESDQILRRIQEAHWSRYAKVDREWPTPHMMEAVHDALQSEDVPRKILVVGIGGLAKDALHYAQIPDTQVVGIDINEQAVHMASDLPKPDSVTFSQENILDPEIIGKLGRESFGAVTMIGLLTNLITDNDAQIALNHSYQLLAPGGSVVISDYALGEGSDYWVGRYERDTQVLEMLGYGDSRTNFGTLIIRPGNLHPDDMGYVSAGNKLDLNRTVESVRSGDFDRMVRHRTRDTFSDLLTRSGFGIPTETKINRLVSPRPSGDTTPWDVSRNIQMRARKPVKRIR